MGIQSVAWPRGHGWRRVHCRLVCLGLSALAVGACDRQAADERAEQRRPHQAGHPVNSLKLAAHLHAARVAAVTGNNKAAEAHIKAVASDIRRSARMPDPHRPIDHEAARAAVRPIEGVRTSLWLDRENFVVMVGGQRHRSIEMFDRVCVAPEPLGDKLAAVVNIQDVAATNADAAKTFSRNYRLAEVKTRSNSKACRGLGGTISLARTNALPPILLSALNPAPRQHRNSQFLSCASYS